MFTYTKTRKGEWVAVGPMAEVAGHELITVSLRNGSTEQRRVFNLGRPFDKQGVSTVYAYLTSRDEDRRDRFTPQVPQATPWAERHGGLPAQHQPERRKAEPGVYVKDGRIYVVRERNFPDSDGPVRYARVIRETGPGGGDKLNEHDETVRYEEDKAPGMVWQLGPEHLMPEADFLAFCQRYGTCISCGRTLRLEESIKRGRGDVCHGRQVLRLAAAGR